MEPTARRWSVLAAAMTMTSVLAAAPSHAINRNEYRCQVGIGIESAKYVSAKLALIQGCKDADLESPGACPAPNPRALRALADDLVAGLAERCNFRAGADDDNLALMGFPGPCADANPSDGFTLADLQACILTSHDAILSGVCGGGTNLGEPCTMVADCPDVSAGTFCLGLVPVEYDPAVSGPLTGTRLACQRQVGKSAARFVVTVMKAVQRCRNELLDCRTSADQVTRCRLSGLAPASCATSDVRTARRILAAKREALAVIASQCADPADVAALSLCDPNQPTGTAAAACEVAIHLDLTDNPDPTALSDLLDFEYPSRGICGDNRLNQGNEECDGIADAACPGQCGPALGFFPCLCQSTPRTRVIEHANADLDIGWKGVSHDSGVVEGGGYVTDLWDCDGPAGPDVECRVGPSCALPPHEACSPAANATGAAADADAMCPNAGNFCRKTAGGATGPHCELDSNHRCRLSRDCPTPGDRCVVTPHGAPLPISAGGVSVCVVNTFTEDVVGTTNLMSGAGAVRIRQDSTTYTGGDPQQPCPVCGGFCSGAGGPTGPAKRNLCTTDDDCAPGSHCIDADICSWGPDIDQPCRKHPPAGGPTDLFGNPSVDCRMAGNFLGTVDIVFDPATTGTASLTADLPCNQTGFNGEVCAGGPNQHAPCTADSECPGGTCNRQCFCPNRPGETQQPNYCQSACLRGPDDGAPCTGASDCAPPGFCHPGDCRLNPADDDSIQEGICTVGPADQRCSVHTFRSCTEDADCMLPSCPFCAASETCEPVVRQCFVNPTIIRQGAAGVPDRTSVATFCIAGTGQVIDGVAGLPGPGAITQPTTTMEVGF